MDFSKYINEEVRILRDEGSSYCEIEGQLISVIPYDEADDCVDTLVVETESGNKLIPENELLQFLPLKELNDESTEYYYVIIRYGKTARSKEHIYMSLDHSVRPGDKVLVWKDWLYVGNVIRTGFFTKSDAPYPVEKTWLIQQKVYPRIDFMKYDDASEVISETNMYKDRALNSNNDYKQYLAKVDYQYQWLSDMNTEHLQERASDKITDMKSYIIGETEYNLDRERMESNQLDVFYRTLWICTYLAKHNCYDKLCFDTFLCLSLIYRHGDFDDYLLIPSVDKKNIDRDMKIAEEYIRRKDSGVDLSVR